MKNYKRLACLFLALAMTLLILAGCDKSEEKSNESGNSSEPTRSADVDQPQNSASSYSDSIDENGFFKNIRALDHIEMFDYHAITIPNEVHQISDEDLQSEIDYIMSEYTSGDQITDRAVEDGDTVNIDFDGSVDDVAFDGGSTGGGGTDVTIGVTQYIDDFLEQLIGHMPGETINVEVTFPDDYGQEELNGKDAVFVTTINYIVNKELTDDFVSENLFDNYGWTTVAEMKESLLTDMKKYSIQQYIKQYMTTEVIVNSLPEQLMDYQINAMLSFYQDYADYNGIDFEELISYEGFSSVDELIEAYYDTNMTNATYLLILIAVAEDAGLTVSDDDVAAYFLRYENTSDYSSFVEQYGLGYIKHNVLCQKVVDYIVSNAVLL